MSNKNEIDWSIPRRISILKQNSLINVEEIGLLLYISILPQKIGKMLLNKNQLLLVLYMIKMLRKMEKEKNRITM